MQSIEEKIYEVFWDKNIARMINRADLFSFLKQYVNPGLLTRSSKSELVHDLKEYMTTANLEFIAERMESFGLPMVDTVSVLDTTSYAVKKLVDNDTLRIVGTFKGGNQRIPYKLCSVLDILDISHAGLLEKKQQPVLPATDENIASALYTINKSAKVSTANIYSSRNSILELVKSQSQAELDVLNKVIDKRKEALSAKKSYYDYDKTLKNKTKDIEVLERQIAALEGSTSAEDKARKAKLQEQLQSAKDDLNDTITDHAYSMQTDALDKLSTDMSEDLDKWINTISSNMEEMTTAINDAVKNAGLSTAGTINAISSILRHYGLSDSEISQSGLSDIKGYASGTDYVPKSGMYRVNEKGMESVFSKQYGTLTFLSQGDKVFTADFTKQLLDNSTIATQKNMPDYAGMAKAIEKNIQNIQNLSGNTYVNNFYIDGAQDTDSILKEIDKHLDKKIQAHDKKQVRDFRSLH